MPTPKRILIGGAGAMARALRAARSRYGRRRHAAGPLPPAEPVPAAERIPPTEPLGPAAPPTARLPAAGDPSAAPPETGEDLTADDVERLRGDLRRELERLAGADVKASRSGQPTSPQG
jgi:hypothetical protein